MKQFLVAFLALVSMSVCADTKLIPDMKFRRLDTQDGLSSSQVNCIYRDSRGFMWFGTPYGLNRYDGFRFRNYYSNIRDTTSMRDNYTDEIYEAYDGKLWLKQGMNYCIYDPVTDSFERQSSRVLSKFGITSGIEKIYIDKNKNFWVKAVSDGIYYYNPNTKKLHHFKEGYEEGFVNPVYGISMFTEYNGNVVAVTYNGEYIVFNGEQGKIIEENKWMKENGGPENQDYRMTIDHEGNIWCIALENTFIHIKKENRWYRTVVEYLQAKGFENLPEKLQVWDFFFDDNGWIWMVTDHEGLFVIDVKNRQLKQFKNNKYDETTISENSPRRLYHDPNGHMWIGNYKNGVNEYVIGMESLKSIEVGDINTVCEDRYGNYWMGSNDSGILVYDPKRGEVVSHFTRDNSGLAGNIMVGSWPASDGSIWFGSYNGGLSRCIPSTANPTQAHIVNWQAAPGGLANNSVWALTEDKWHRIWFTTLGGGLQMLDPKTGEFTTWNTKNTKLPSDYLSSIGWTKKGWLLTGTSYYYALTNPVSRQLVTQVFPESPNITVTTSNTNYIIEDSRGLLWQGSSSGLTVYDPMTKFIVLLDMTDGLLGSGINSITEDHRRNIWAVTDHGVSQIVPVRQDDGTWQFNIRSFNSRDGLQKATYNQRSTWVTRDGRLLIGGQGGLDIINTNELQQEDSKERPVFSGLQIFDQDVAVGKEFDGRIILHEALDICRKISLKYNDQFTIQLATNEVDIKNQKRFAYLLEGFNDNWVKTSKLNPNITFNSLSAGSYILHVRILKEDGTMYDEESTLEITIRPPLWRAPWMILLYILVIALAVWLWYKRFLQQQEERMQLEQMRRETEKRHWMSEMRKQLEQEGHQARPDNPGAPGNPKNQENPKAPDSPASPNTLPQFEHIDIVPLCRKMCDQFQAPQGKTIRLSYFPLVDTLNVMGNKIQLRRMIQILLENAANFSPNNSKVKVFVEQNQDKAVIRVADNGIGIPTEVMPHLFEQIVGDEDSPNLHEVFDIVMTHHGTINASQNKGSGTVFTIEIPCREEIVVEEAVMMDEEE